jgi:hypothetical protein
MYYLDSKWVSPVIKKHEPCALYSMMKVAYRKELLTTYLVEDSPSPASSTAAYKRVKAKRGCKYKAQ